MRITGYILLAVMVAGCQTVKSTWDNFSAYHNTYYNAKKIYSTALEKVENQPLSIDPDRPLRIHRPPVNVAAQEFQKAIDKGARILRRHPESKWVDEALWMIGKSYYYRGELFSALQKFEEQYVNARDSDLKQEAVIWKGISLLEMNQYERGILYLEDELNNEEIDWDTGFRAEAVVTLAELYAGAGDWEPAAEYLSDAVGDLKKGKLKGKTYFLYGQTLEQLERYGEASFAFSRVSENYPDFELLYWSKRKRGIVLRKMGSYDQAISLFESMQNDDKYTQQVNELKYEKARTREQMGRHLEAMSQYRETLANTNTPVSGELKSNIYYRLAEIHRNRLNDLKTAGAYYDSTSMYKGQEQELAENVDVQDLAQTFGKYKKLRNQINNLDSLLWLSDLPPGERDSVLRRIRQQRLNQIKQEQSNNDTDVLINVEDEQQGDQGSRAIYGYLNYRNAQLVAESKSSFRAVWGRRPLVDNWRRMEAVRNSSSSSASSESETERDRDVAVAASPGNAGGINPGDIPVTGEEKEAMRGRLASAKYELGNLFYMTIGQPDSAEYYYRALISDHSRDTLVPKALYSLFEINRMHGDTTDAARWREQLRENYPNSRYYRELSRDSEETGLDEVGSGDSLRLHSGVAAAEQLRTKAQNAGRQSHAALLYYMAIEEYIKLARSRADSASYEKYWKADPDTTAGLTEDRPSPFEGGYWDSVRVLLDEYSKHYPRTRFSGRVETLEKILNRPARQEAAVDCSELETMPQPVTGMEGFLNRIRETVFRDTTDYRIPDQVTVDLIIGEDGLVTSYSVQTAQLAPSFREAFEKAVGQNLEFKPVSVDGKAVTVRCSIPFPVGRLR